MLAHLAPEPGAVVVDGTAGGGGHARAIAERIGPNGTLVCLDRDPTMLARAQQAVAGPGRHFVAASYARLAEVLADLGRTEVDGVLLDLGLSSDQLADEERGFGFESGAVLDMRFDPASGRPAWQWLEETDEAELERILREFGEERFSREIAAAVAARRRTSPIRTAADLSETVRRAIPDASLRTARKHPATRVFQALRIAANEELEQLRRMLEDVLPATVRTGGRVVIVSFHSLEDRLVKDAFRDRSRWQSLTPKPVSATPAEQRINPRSRSAKLRAAVRR